MIKKTLLQDQNSSAIFFSKFLFFSRSLMILACFVDMFTKELNLIWFCISQCNPKESFLRSEPHEISVIKICE